MGLKVSKKISILFVHASADLYGSDKVLLDLVLNIDRNLFESIVILPEKGPLFYLIKKAGIEVHDLPIAKITRSAFTFYGVINLGFRTITSLYGINKIVGDRKIDIVHSNTLAVVSGAFWSFLTNTKHLWHVHEIIEHPDIISTYYPKLVNLFSYRVVTNSDATRFWLENKSPDIVSKVVTILNGLAHTDPVAKSESSRIRAFCNAPHEEIVVVLVGRISRWKGQKLFVDALELLADKGIMTIRALIVGSPPAGQEHFKADLVEYISESRAAEFIYLLDHTDNIWPVWAACDIAVVPSIEPEPFGMVAIEAMSARKPVIAANHGGLVEIVEDGITGILVPPRDACALANAIEAVAIDSELRRKMGENGFVRQKKYFSLEAYIHAFESQYLDIVSH